MKLMRLDRFRKLYFEKSSAPDPRTIRGWIESWAIPGVMINDSAYYIDQEKWEALMIANGDQEIDTLIGKALDNGATATH
ncbi:hypothetical protein [Acidithiobacillus sp.]|uniref:hypothetical protein n=1 Tax=Acidithiobacillus sp. TaxID=1872118 RepID=UPI00260440A0|nr:hypothetical protein [Acidithiobacillus sp.]